MTEEQIKVEFDKQQAEIVNLLKTDNVLEAQDMLTGLRSIFLKPDLLEKNELIATLKASYKELQDEWEAKKKEKIHNLRDEITRMVSAPKTFDFERIQVLLRELSALDSDLDRVEALTQKVNTIQSKRLILAVEDILKEKVDEEKANSALILLDDAQKLVGAKSEIENLRVLVDEASRNHRAQKKFDSTKQACETLWAQEQDLLRQKAASFKILDDIFDKAKTLAEKAASEFPKSLLIDGLKNDAVMRYQMARKRYEIKTTADQAGEYRVAFEQLEKIEDKESFIPWNDENGQQLGPLTVRDAIREILKLAGDYASKKAQEYLRSSQSELNNHSPRTARERIEERKKLWELSADDNVPLQKYLDEKILPELKKLEDAEELLALAGTTSNSLQGWDLVDEAVKTYPWVANVEITRNGLVSRILHQTDVLLSETSKAITVFTTEANNAALDDAELKLVDVHKMLDIVRPYLEQNSNQANQEKLLMLSQVAQNTQQTVLSARQFLTDIDRETSSLESLFVQDPAQSQPVWDGLMTTYNSPQYVAKYGELLKRFPRLQSLQVRIQAFQNFEISLQELEDRFASQDIEIIGSALENTRAVLDDVKDTARRKRVRAIIAKFQGRLEFLDGQKALTDNGDVNKALEHFNKLIVYDTHPDKQAAQELINRLLSERENEQKVSDALENAKAFLENRPRRAYEILKKVADVPTRQKKELNGSLERARELWELHLLNRLENLREAKKVEPDTIRKLAREILDILPEPHADETEPKAREALAFAFALEAKIHATTGHWEKAEKSWKAAQEKDAFNREYEEGWRDARLRRAKVQLERAKGEQEIQGVLADLQLELVDDPGVFELQAEYNYRLSQNLALNTEARQMYLSLAQSAIKVASKASNTSNALKGRLDDLLQKVEADESLLKTQIDIEKRMSSDASLAQLSSAVLDVNKMLEMQNISPVARDGVQAWWSDLVPRIVKTLEAKDDRLTDESLWERFEVRSKIAFLQSDNPHAQMLVRTVPHQVEVLLDLINAAISDRSGLTWKADDSIQILNIQQAHIFELRERAQMLHEMTERLSRSLGGQAAQLKNDIQNALTRMQTWIRQFEVFRQKVLHLREFLSQARQDNDWGDFDQILNEINAEAFGSHRSVRMLLEERDRVLDKRKELKTYHDKIIDAAQDPQGLRFIEAINLLDVLEKDPRQGDPQDDFGFQTDLQINDPITNKIIRQAYGVRMWLEERQKQTDQVITWLVECGLVDLIPTNIPVPTKATQVKKVLPWDEIRDKLAQELEHGNFIDVLIGLDNILSESENHTENRPKRVSRRGDSNTETILKSYEGFSRLQDARKTIAQPPLSMEMALSKFVNSLLQKASERLHAIDDHIEEINQLRISILEKQQAWEDAELELGQALKEWRDVKGRFYFFGRETALQAARKRAQKAILACRAIAPHHPVLNDIDSFFE